MCVCACAHACGLWLTWGGRKITCGSQFSPSTMWAPGIELKPLGLVANIFPLSHLTSPKKGFTFKVS